MRTWKQNAFIGMVAIIVFIFGIVACDDGNGKNDPETVETPTATPTQGNYDEPQNVELSTATTGASIYYTIDGNAPTVNSTLYSSPIAINAPTTLKAFAVKNGMNDSGIFSATYTITVFVTVNKTVDVSFPAFSSGTTLNLEPTYNPNGGWGEHFSASDITYIVTDNSGKEFPNGTGITISSGSYENFTTYTFTQTFKMNEVIIESQDIKADVMFGNFAGLKNTSDATITSIPPITLSLEKKVPQVP
jgi:hypothetical protein